MLTKISAQTLGSAAASITFSSIPQTYRHLYVVFYGRGSSSFTEASAMFTFNGDTTGANYDGQRLQGSASTASSTEYLGVGPYTGQIPDASTAAGLAGGLAVTIFDYARTTWQKTAVVQNALKIGTSSGNVYNRTFAQFWRNTAAITSLTITAEVGNFTANTTAVLYGMGASGGTDVIGETVLSVDTASITFSSIPATSKHLRVVAFGRSNNAALTTAFYADLNGDTAANYDWQRLAGTASTASAVESLATSAMEAATLTGDTATANVASGAVITVYDYARTSWQKSVSALSATKWGTASGQVRVQANSGFWRNTAAITSITLYPGSGSLKSGSLATLYGFD